MEISDEVVGVVLKAFKKSRDYEFDTLAIAMRDALQAAIPLVVEGLVGDEVYASNAPIHFISSEAEFWVIGMNRRRNDILVKVKK